MIEHNSLMAIDRAARLIQWPALREEGEEAWSVNDFAEVTRALVNEVQLLRQKIAIRAQEDRIAEQIEKGFR